MRPSLLRSMPLCSALLALTAAACGTATQYTALNKAPHALAPKAPADVLLYTSGPPAVPYTELGMIQGNQESEYSHVDMRTIIAAMRSKAGQMGCDGLVINGAAAKQTDLLFANKEARTRTLEGYWGTCIVFTPPPSVGAAPPPPPAPPVPPAGCEPRVVAPPPAELTPAT